MGNNDTNLPTKQAFSVLDSQWEFLGRLETALLEIRNAQVEFVSDSIDRSIEKLAAFEPTVSVIGQVKAGKSTLLNALVGETDLLPSDVNPWTSVITGLHLNSRRRPPRTAALFRFFDAHEWDRLIKTGGRLGEMANRVGFESEAEEVRSQVMKMREATEQRLGDQFHSLLGSSHSFETIEQDVIDRYICYGDPEDLSGGANDGVYADITKTADLYLDSPDFPANLCFRDTPGVNDTFMMREQTTLNAISESRACIVVLSAHQALTTMDMALLRIICAVDAREVVIFVNRMDELSDPVGEEARLRNSIQKTLDRFGMGNEIEILFGSGRWAQAAITGDLSTLAPASRAALTAWTRAKGQATETPEALMRVAHEASGLPALMQAVATRIAEGPGARMVEEMKAEAQSIISMVETVQKLKQSSANGDQTIRKQIGDRLTKITGQVENGYAAAVEKARDDLQQRLKRAQAGFVETALKALADHIATYGEIDSWTHEPMSLRMSMRSAYLSSCKALDREALELIETGCSEIQDIIEVDMGMVGADIPDDAPYLPALRTPSSLAKTLSLDLNSAWWQKFWRFGSQGRIRKKYTNAILSETDPLIEELVTKHFDARTKEVSEVIEDYLDDRSRFIRAILDHTSEAGDKEARNVA